VYVGLVSGKEEVYKNGELGNIELLNGENKVEKYIYTEKYPSGNEKIDQYLAEHKTELIGRGIRKFNEHNWFEWGAPRNIASIQRKWGEECIYVYNLTRNPSVAFAGKVQYFGGALLMLVPKKKEDLLTIVNYLNSREFKHNFMFSGRFKIGHHALSNSLIPKECFMASHSSPSPTL
jgi:adenine-specific DNA-methyltransferase